jgi:hypothetical protein
MDDLGMTRKQAYAVDLAGGNLFEVKPDEEVFSMFKYGSFETEAEAKKAVGQLTRMAAQGIKAQ